VIGDDGKAIFLEASAELAGKASGSRSASVRLTEAMLSAVIVLMAPI
jgi:hypothetical protein